MKTAMIKLFFLCVLASVSVFSVAQNPNPSAQPNAQPSNNIDQEAIDPATVDKFVVAYQSVISLQKDLADQLQNVNDNQQAQALQMKAQEKMMDVVVDSGLTIEEYNGVVMEMGNNPELAQQVRNKIK